MDSAVLITYDQDDMIDEAVALCESADYKVKHIIKQNFLQKPKYGLSGGKIEDLKEIISTVKPDVIVFDEILKPSQNYNLASELKMEILDREALILQIFEKRSSSAESKLQVKLAQARYDMSRAKEKVRLSKKGEQPGFMGLGTFEVDVYYNEIKKRMINIKSKLVKSGKQRKLHRQARKRLGFKTISLAGYTSAGKTTLFNALTGEQREKNDELFTTLSTTVRRVMINQEIALISDTVGFISRLPAYMIEAFKSTLEELLYTDVIIFVIDASDNLDELRKKFKSCYTTLNEIGVESNKLVFALNKSELLDGDQVLDIVDYLELKGNKKWVDISAVTGKNILVYGSKVTYDVEFFLKKGGKIRFYDQGSGFDISDDATILLENGKKFKIRDIKHAQMISNGGQDVSYEYLDSIGSKKYTKTTKKNFFVFLITQ